MNHDNLFNQIKHFTQKYPVNIVNRSDNKGFADISINLHKTVNPEDLLIMTVLKKRPKDNQIKVSF